MVWFGLIWYVMVLFGMMMSWGEKRAVLDTLLLCVAGRPTIRHACLYGAAHTRAASNRATRVFARQGLFVIAFGAWVDSPNTIDDDETWRFCRTSV